MYPERGLTLPSSGPAFGRPLKSNVRRHQLDGRCIRFNLLLSIGYIQLETRMSINSMANAAAARRPDTVPVGQVPASLDEIAKASTTPPTVTPQLGQEGMPGATQSSVDTALNVLFGYIPTEVITLYVAVLAAVQQTTAVSSTEWTTFCIFVAATPVVVWLVYGAKLLHVKKTLPVSFGSIPVWEMFAATCAFAAWAFALPHSPFTSFSWYSSGLSGVAVLVVSTVLGLLAPFFQRPLTE